MHCNPFTTSIGTANCGGSDVRLSTRPSAEIADAVLEAVDPMVVAPHLFRPHRAACAGPAGSMPLPHPYYPAAVVPMIATPSSASGDKGHSSCVGDGGRARGGGAAVAAAIVGCEPPPPLSVSEAVAMRTVVPIECHEGFHAVLRGGTPANGYAHPSPSLAYALLRARHHHSTREANAAAKSASSLQIPAHFPPPPPRVRLITSEKGCTNGSHGSSREAPKESSYLPPTASLPPALCAEMTAFFATVGCRMRIETNAPGGAAVMRNSNARGDGQEGPLTVFTDDEDDGEGIGSRSAKENSPSAADVGFSALHLSSQPQAAADNRGGGKAFVKDRPAIAPADVASSIDIIRRFLRRGLGHRGAIEANEWPYRVPLYDDCEEGRRDGDGSAEKVEAARGRLWRLQHPPTTLLSSPHQPVASCVSSTQVNSQSNAQSQSQPLRGYPIESLLAARRFQPHVPYPLTFQVIPHRRYDLRLLMAIRRYRRAARLIKTVLWRHGLRQRRETAAMVALWEAAEEAAEAANSAAAAVSTAPDSSSGGFLSAAPLSGSDGSSPLLHRRSSSLNRRGSCATAEGGGRSSSVAPTATPSATAPSSGTSSPLTAPTSILSAVQPLTTSNTDRSRRPSAVVAIGAAAWAQSAATYGGGNSFAVGGSPTQPPTSGGSRSRPPPVVAFAAGVGSATNSPNIARPDAVSPASPVLSLSVNGSAASSLRVPSFRSGGSGRGGGTVALPLNTPPSLPAPFTMTLAKRCILHTARREGCRLFIRRLRVWRRRSDEVLRRAMERCEAMHAGPLCVYLVAATLSSQQPTLASGATVKVSSGDVACSRCCEWGVTRRSDGRLLALEPPTLSQCLAEAGALPLFVPASLKALNSNAVVVCPQCRAAVGGGDGNGHMILAPTSLPLTPEEMRAARLLRPPPLSEEGLYGFLADFLAEVSGIGVPFPSLAASSSIATTNGGGVGADLISLAGGGPLVSPSLQSLRSAAAAAISGDSLVSTTQSILRALASPSTADFGVGGALRQQRGQPLRSLLSPSSTAVVTTKQWAAALIGSANAAPGSAVLSGGGGGGGSTRGLGPLSTAAAANDKNSIVSDNNDVSQRSYADSLVIAAGTDVLPLLEGGDLSCSASRREAATSSSETSAAAAAKAAASAAAHSAVVRLAARFAADVAAVTAEAVSWGAARGPARLLIASSCVVNNNNRGGPAQNESAELLSSSGLGSVGVGGGAEAPAEGLIGIAATAIGEGARGLSASNVSGPHTGEGSPLSPLVPPTAAFAASASVLTAKNASSSAASPHPQSYMQSALETVKDETRGGDNNNSITTLDTAITNRQQQQQQQQQQRPTDAATAVGASPLPRRASSLRGGELRSAGGSASSNANVFATCSAPAAVGTTNKGSAGGGLSSVRGAAQRRSVLALAKGAVAAEPAAPVPTSGGSPTHAQQILLPPSREANNSRSPPLRTVAVPSPPPPPPPLSTPASSVPLSGQRHHFSVAVGALAAGIAPLSFSANPSVDVTATTIGSGTDAPRVGGVGSLDAPSSSSGGGGSETNPFGTMLATFSFASAGSAANAHTVSPASVTRKCSPPTLPPLPPTPPASSSAGSTFTFPSPAAQRRRTATGGGGSPPLAPLPPAASAHIPIASSPLCSALSGGGGGHTPTAATAVVGGFGRSSWPHRPPSSLFAGSASHGAPHSTSPSPGPHVHANAELGGSGVFSASGAARRRRTSPLSSMAARGASASGGGHRASGSSNGHYRHSAFGASALAGGRDGERTPPTGGSRQGSMGIGATATAAEQQQRLASQFAFADGLSPIDRYIRTRQKSILANDALERLLLAGGGAEEVRATTKADAASSVDAASATAPTNSSEPIAANSNNAAVATGTRDGPLQPSHHQSRSVKTPPHSPPPLIATSMAAPPTTLNVNANGSHSPPRTLLPNTVGSGRGRRFFVLHSMEGERPTATIAERASPSYRLLEAPPLCLSGGEAPSGGDRSSTRSAALTSGSVPPAAALLTLSPSSPRFAVSVNGSPHAASPSSPILSRKGTRANLLLGRSVSGAALRGAGGCGFGGGGYGSARSLLTALNSDDTTALLNTIRRGGGGEAGGGGGRGLGTISIDLADLVLGGVGTPSPHPTEIFAFLPTLPPNWRLGDEGFYLFGDVSPFDGGDAFHEGTAFGGESTPNHLAKTNIIPMGECEQSPPSAEEVGGERGRSAAVLPEPEPSSVRPPPLRAPSGVRFAASAAPSGYHGDDDTGGYLTTSLLLARGAAEALGGSTSPLSPDAAADRASARWGVAGAPTSSSGNSSSSPASPTPTSPPPIALEDTVAMAALSRVASSLQAGGALPSPPAHLPAAVVQRGAVVSSNAKNAPRSGGSPAVASGLAGGNNGGHSVAATRLAVRVIATERFPSTRLRSRSFARASGAADVALSAGGGDDDDDEGADEIIHIALVPCSDTDAAGASGATVGLMLGGLDAKKSPSPPHRPKPNKVGAPAFSYVMSEASQSYMAYLAGEGPAPGAAQGRRAPNAAAVSLPPVPPTATSTVTTLVNDGGVGLHSPSCPEKVSSIQRGRGGSANSSASYADRPAVTARTYTAFRVRPGDTDQPPPPTPPPGFGPAARGIGRASSERPNIAATSMLFSTGTAAHSLPRTQRDERSLMNSLATPSPRSLSALTAAGRLDLPSPCYHPHASPLRAPPRQLFSRQREGDGGEDGRGITSAVVRREVRPQQPTARTVAASPRARSHQQQHPYDNADCSAALEQLFAFWKLGASPLSALEA